MEHFPLHTTRLILREFIESDLPSFTAYRNQPDVARYQSWSSFSRENAEAFFREQKQLIFDMDGTWFQIAVLNKQDSILIGDIAVHFFDEGRQAELGMTFDSAYQGQGYAMEAVYSVIKLLFSGLAKHRIIATVDVRNVSAQRLLEKQGFRREAYFIENIFLKALGLMNTATLCRIRNGK